MVILIWKLIRAALVCYVALALIAGMIGACVLVLPFVLIKLAIEGLRRLRGAGPEYKTMDAAAREAWRRDIIDRWKDNRVVVPHAQD